MELKKFKTWCSKKQMGNKVPPRTAGRLQNMAQHCYIQRVRRLVVFTHTSHHWLEVFCKFLPPQKALKQISAGAQSRKLYNCVCALSSCGQGTNLYQSHVVSVLEMWLNVSVLPSMWLNQQMDPRCLKATAHSLPFYSQSYHYRAQVGWIFFPKLFFKIYGCLFINLANSW